jgi:hypothetical protein
MPRLVAGTVIDGLFLLIACVTVNEEIKEDPPNGAMLTCFQFLAHAE